jgi:hypothetical protein
MTELDQLKIIDINRKPLISIDEARFLLLGLYVTDKSIFHSECKYNFTVHVGPVYIRDYVQNRLVVELENFSITKVIRFG